MKIAGQEWQLAAIHNHIWRGRIEAGELPRFARSVKDEGGQLIALWGSDDRHLSPLSPGGRRLQGSSRSATPGACCPGAGGEGEMGCESGGFSIHAAFITPAGLAWVSAGLAAGAPAYPDLAAIFPQADRMQRAAYDLLGIRAEGAVDDRKWLRHGAWPADTFPLRKDCAAEVVRELDAYPFIRVEGDGPHEIPVGPIHAGTIEPGHFRFSIIGDRVLKLEQRLGYTHKGTEKRFEGMDLATGAKLAGRVSGDSHSAYAWAYCMAVETATGCEVPERARWLRALFLEIERIANHLGDLGYLGNDVALSFGFMQFWRLKEELLRLTGRLFGHRYLFDRIIPGGVAVDLVDGGEILALADRLEDEIQELKAVYDEHSTLQDRMANTGIATPEMAERLGLIGLAGRASGQAWDARVRFPQCPYDRLEVRMAGQRKGDVLARAEVRFAEITESLRLIRAIVRELPAGAIAAPVQLPNKLAEGIGWVEGWRGEIVVAVRIGSDGRLDRVHPHDPSWQNWPLLEVGILGNIVPDFPLINKSFNLSYSGQDL